MTATRHGPLLIPEFDPTLSEDIKFEDGKLLHISKQNVDGIIRAAADAADSLKKDTGPIQGRYLGTVPVLIAQQWAKECGAAIGTKEWNKYAKVKLKDGTWAKLRVHGK